MVQTAGAVTLSPLRERGYATSTDPGGTSGWWSDLTQETTPELVWPLSIAVFDRMRKQDAQVASVLRAVQSPIIRTQWRVDGTGCSDDVTKFVASNLGLPIVGADGDTFQEQIRGRDRFSWDDHLRLALLMLPFGHSFFEQVYRVDDAGRYRIRKLGPRLPRTIAKVNVAGDGGLVSIEQTNMGLAGGNSNLILPVSRLVAYVLEREGGNWLGQSILRSAYKHWLLKDRALRTWSTLIDRQGIGVPVYTAAEKEESLAAGLAIATSMRAGDNSGTAIGHGAKLELMGVTGTLPDVDAFVRYQDEQIARSALGHFLNLGTQHGGQVGSYNLGSVLAGIFNSALEAVAAQVQTTANEHIIEDLVDINFGPTVPAPRVVFDEIGTRFTELDRAREAAGLSSDADLVKFLRDNPASQEATA